PLDQFRFVAPPAPPEPAPTPAPGQSPSTPEQRLICGHVPTLVGLTMRRARKALDRNGCEDVRLKRAGKKRGRSRLIVKQHPAPGTPVYAGDRVRVRVRLG